MTKKLTAYRGDSFSLNLNFTDNAKPANPIDITGWTVILTIKIQKIDSDAQAVVQKTVISHINPTQGQTVIAVSPSETNNLLGDYYYDVQFRKPDGTVKTIVESLVRFKEDITRKVS